jgi:ABC-type Zn uptake system ZnuABC Zn-binding protein ZnuA
LKLILCLLLAFTLAATAGERLRVSCFSTILTEVATEVGGDRVNVHGHLRPGNDPHSFEPRPSDLRIVADAQVVLLSAKHIEAYIGKLREATGSRAAFVEVGDGFASLHLPDEGRPGASIEDPHWWHSIANMRHATQIVRDAFIAASPGDRATFTAGAAQYLAQLDALEAWARNKFAELPRDARKLVTSHDAFQYFARDYGFTVYAIAGLTPADQPSSAKVVRIIAAIRAQRVKAVFPENIENPKVLGVIMRESGAQIGPVLYADGLGEGEGRTYAGMFRHNVTAIVDALK